MTSPAAALSELLAALGFRAMADDCATETRPEYLRRYARVVLKNAPAAQKEALRTRFVMLRLV